LLICKSQKYLSTPKHKNVRLLQYAIWSSRNPTFIELTIWIEVVVSFIVFADLYILKHFARKVPIDFLLISNSILLLITVSASYVPGAALPDSSRQRHAPLYGRLVSEEHLPAAHRDVHHQVSLSLFIQLGHF
jgi:hypothetical protein